MTYIANLSMFLGLRNTRKLRFERLKKIFKKARRNRKTRAEILILIRYLRTQKLT